jgi:hypothetical protein
VRQYKVKAFDSTEKSFLIGLAGVNVTGDGVNLTGDGVNVTIWVSVYQDPIKNYARLSVKIIRTRITRRNDVSWTHINSQ